MKSSLIAAVIALGFVGLASHATFAAEAQCEDMLQKLRDKEASAQPSDKAAYEDLKNKGIERCNADDDARADDFFTQAMALLSK